MTADYKNMSTITWLHLSDLQLCNPKSGWEAGKILKKLQEDFQKLHDEEGLTPDMIFFTGDIVFGDLGKVNGKQIVEQFTDAADFFDKIRTSFSPAIPKERVFIVPGNHDVNRNKISRSLHQAFDGQMTGDYRDIEKKLNCLIADTGNDEWKSFIRRLKEYRQFLQFNGYTHLVKDPDRLIYAIEEEINGVKVGIAGFNSAWSSWQDNEKGKLWMAGHWQIQDLSSRLDSSPLKIALMHHPFNWFNTAEDPNTFHEMQNHFDFFLHGHEHQGWVEEGGDGYKRIAAGTCYGDNEEEMGYNITRLNIDKQGNFTGKVWLRKYDHLIEGWTQHPVHGQAGDGIRLIKKGLEFPVQAEEEVVGKEFPVDTPGSRGVLGRDEEIARVAEMVNEVPITFIYGMPGIGKTLLIDEVRRHPLLKERRYYRYPIGREMDLERLFALMAPALGCRDEFPQENFVKSGKYNFSALKKYAQFRSPAVLHLEHAHRLIENGKFKDKGVAEFFKVLATNPQFKIIIESGEETETVLSPPIYKGWEVHGLDIESMATYFLRPFKERPLVSWVLNEPDKEFIYSRLGGNKVHDGAHPLAMMLLASLADGVRKTPVQILRDFEEGKGMVQDLESRLFTDLYEKVLSPAQQHMLRLFSLYREGIPDFHMKRLNEAVGDENAFSMLKKRCLLTPDENGDRYYLHSLISEMTQSRHIVSESDYRRDHDIIAGAWLTQLKISSHINLPDMQAADHVLYHLTEAENYEGYYELSEKLLRQDVIPHLEQLSKKLLFTDKHQENRCVLDLLVRLEPTEPKYHRFLAQTIESLKGKGDDEAFRHYQEAYRLSPTFPRNLNNLGLCMLARGNAQEFVTLLESLDPGTYRKSTDNETIAIYTNCLLHLAQGEKATRFQEE